MSRYTTIGYPLSTAVSWLRVRHGRVRLEALAYHRQRAPATAALYTSISNQRYQQSPAVSFWDCDAENGRKAMISHNMRCHARLLHNPALLASFCGCCLQSVIERSLDNPRIESLRRPPACLQWARKGTEDLRKKNPLFYAVIALFYLLGFCSSLFLYTFACKFNACRCIFFVSS